MPPDYTTQLNQIVQLLSKPGLPSWIPAVIGAFIGILGSGFVQVFLRWYDKRQDIARMTLVLYGDLGDLFSVVNSHLLPESEDDEHKAALVYQGLQRDLSFKGETYLKSKLDIYMQLPERPAADHLYKAFHNVVDNADGKLARRCRRALWLVGFYLHDKRLDQRDFVKHMPGSTGEALVRRANALYQLTLEQNQDTPALKIDEDPAPIPKTND